VTPAALLSACRLAPVRLVSSGIATRLKLPASGEVVLVSVRKSALMPYSVPLVRPAWSSVLPVACLVPT
jgi:hypothetical protein